jgi:hypothetical protein
VDSSFRATEDQWLDLLSEIGYLLGKLEVNGERARARTDDINAPAWDAYPASSLPEGSIARGRVSRPVENAVIRHAGGKDAGYRLKDGELVADGEAAELDDETTTDTWRERFDPIGASVNRMRAEVYDACNRLATAQAASYPARGFTGGEVYGIPSENDPWPTLLGKARVSLDRLVAGAAELRPTFRTPEVNAGRSYMERETLDARNRLRGAVQAMTDVLPVPMPETTRELCAGCGTAKDVVTWWGQKPNNWIKSEAKCRACAKRVGENSKAS